ncbi:hypothetical protein CI1B_54500 [Bradyrhizobium ivorense]|uniref:Chromosome partition protein Smc n=1 Tax=Bradyrhizobium ivorense TaxID=2511166 RepID=A0A508TK54_9BRAD|nr:MULTISPECIES: hypothetical protein [Bradyrhizobium]QOZ25969.1 hypothetical protein XH93_21910 [Bradyrhizobium sp. CCBAU 51753]VIO74182.1 hypothetical protein CI41S_42740 [Bradyrhizobium ivorense]VIO74675.1 hypothetical protein CI1B_54500 [Bradyrhizobium ivorense]
MSDVETKPTMTTIILIAILVLNVLGIGLSEVQRRQLGQQSFLATLELRDIEKQRLEQQATELNRLYGLVANIDQRISKVQAAVENAELAHLNSLVTNVDQRINKVQTALESGPLALQVKDIQARINAVQIKLDQAPAGK